MTEIGKPVIYQLRVVLESISPLIWRRLLVPGDYSIADLHFILQIAFDWDDINLHRFFFHGKDYGIYHSGGMSFSDDPYQVQLADFKFRKSEKFLYEYDFFNGWTHLIRIEDILSFDPKKSIRFAPVAETYQFLRLIKRQRNLPKWRLKFQIS